MSFFSPLVRVMVILSGMAFLAMPARTVAQDLDYSSNSTGTRIQGYRVHDLDDTSLLTRATWAAQWVYAPMSFKAVLPLHAYEYDSICTQYVDDIQELDDFRSLMLGQETWNPAEYELGHAGLVLEDGTSTGPDRTLTGLLLEPSGGTSSLESTTLGGVCGEVQAIMSRYLSPNNSRQENDNQAINAQDWFLVTENPIPDVEPVHRLWTHLDRDIDRDIDRERIIEIMGEIISSGSAPTNTGE